MAATSDVSPLEFYHTMASLLIYVYDHNVNMWQSHLPIRTLSNVSCQPKSGVFTLNSSPMTVSSPDRLVQEERDTPTPGGGAMGTRSYTPGSGAMGTRSMEDKGTQTLAQLTQMEQVEKQVLLCECTYSYCSCSLYKI